MRIISGNLKGRVFQAPSGHKTHPMSDKMRGALFTMLGDLQGLTVLDASAGSGALSFEAISRGAASVVAIDADRTAQQAIAQNTKKLGLQPQVKLIKASAGAWLNTAGEVFFDIVLCDPPYDDLQLPLVARLASRVKPQGLLVLSWPGGIELPALPDVTLIEQRGYGDAQLGFYRR